MNPSSEDIKDMLLDESSLDLTFATNLFIGKEPPDPDNTVTIFDTLSSTPQLTMDPSEPPYERPSVQIRVRNRDYLAGWRLIDSIYSLLHGRAHETRNGAIYEVITSTSPMHLDWDDHRRARFIINLNIQRR